MIRKLKYKFLDIWNHSIIQSLREDQKLLRSVDLPEKKNEDLLLYNKTNFVTS